MAPVLTLHKGGNARTFEHRPSEVARQKMLAAESLAVRNIAAEMKRQAETLPGDNEVRRKLVAKASKLSVWADRRPRVT
jgi:hypothetical protein